MNSIYSNILQTIGATPVIRINKLAPAHVNMFVKVEAFNPMASVKDRLALGVIEAAERDGSLQPGQTVVEATSGNTGIGLAMVCAQKGYPLVVVMAENFSVERRRLMRFLGAKVVLTPAVRKGTGMLAKAAELAKQHGWFLPRQFENEANADIHSRTTAPEILAAFEDRQLNYWVSGFGTGGTLKGVARALKAARPDVQIIATEPENSALMASGIAQQYDTQGQPEDSHPRFRPHLMQGWSPDFISKLANDVLQMGLVDEFIGVNGEESLRLARELATQEGIFCGISSGATFHGALQVAKHAPAGSNILCMLPDTGERYLSTALFDGIEADMDSEELAISDSTASCQFSSRSGRPRTREQHTIEVPAAARQFLEESVRDSKEPVVIFALEWCEFCWSVRKMLSKLGVSCRIIDLDSVAFQENDFGGDIRAALQEKVGSSTIPQIFVRGEYLGGATETFDAFNKGRLQRLFEQQDIEFDTKAQFNAYSFLPKWLHPREAS
ncbi:cysteine synthase A [Halioglobus maricola]|uniref:Cysteine synthase B n=1 Tax=Halioglobus maricola TaxID=2601894 RepID=A0A5P9NP40_9GAMM|nr:cysteine synthase A [Halioglobus maricola]